MFKNQLREDLVRIFDIDKVTFEAPSESNEQAAIFVDINNVKSKIVDKWQSYRVDVGVRIFARDNALPFGFLMKQIQLADPKTSRRFFFYDLEENVGTYQNINERSFRFIYFYETQFDPNKGELTELEF